jgi:hypothetical protein
MKKTLAALTAAMLLCLAAPALAGTSKGQTVYVPCSSHIYHGVKTRPFDLTVTLMVRNTDPRRAITITSVDYHGSDGRLVRRMIAGPLSLQPLATREFVVEQNDTSGGAGASFLLRWRADAAVNEPVAESVMIGTTNSQGISFTSRGVVIQE